MWWNGYLQSTKAKDLTLLAIIIFEIVMNEAGCEWVFSLVKETTKDQRNQMKLDKVEKVTKVSAEPIQNLKNDIWL